MKASTGSTLIRAMVVLVTFGFIGSVSYANEEGPPPSPKVCEGGTPVPSTLVQSVTFPNNVNKACKKVIGQVGCGVKFGTPSEQDLIGAGPQSKTCETNGVSFTFMVDEDNTLTVESENGTKFDTVGFKAGGRQCLTAYSNEPAKVTDLAVIQGGSNLPVRLAFACTDETEQTNLPYVNARNPDGLVDEPCQLGETFVGDAATGRGVCVRCLSGPLTPPPDGNDACPLGGCTDVFQVAVFDSDTKDGNLSAAECGPPVAGDVTAAVGNAAAENEFAQCDEDIPGPGNGEQKCRAAGEIGSAFEFYPGGSGGCAVISGRRTCVSR